METTLENILESVKFTVDIEHDAVYNVEESLKPSNEELE